MSLRQRIKGSSDPEAVWGEASLRQVSLLRASMRADLAIYSSPASPTGRGPELGKEDREFLVASKVTLNRQPWRPRSERVCFYLSGRRHCRRTRSLASPTHRVPWLIS